jgi:hypothetical protein
MSSAVLDIGAVVDAPRDLGIKGLPQVGPEHRSRSTDGIGPSAHARP